MEGMACRGRGLGDAPDRRDFRAGDLWRRKGADHEF